jgi:signal transduction histidine kinase
MNQVIDFFRKLFDTSDWPPRWHCGQWSDFHGWLYIISDLLIWSAYFAIPLFILRYVSQKTNARFTRIYFLFAAFILACGSTHLLDALMFWFPLYRLSAVVRLFTGIISWVTVFHIVRLLPSILKLKSADELEKEVYERGLAEERLRVAVRQLNEAQEIARMGHWQWDIASNEVTWSDGMFKVYGIAPANRGLKYEEFLECVHPDDRTFVDESIRQAFTQKQFTPFTHRIVAPGGAVKMLQSKGEVLLNSAGEITGMIGTGQDITDQFQVQQSLREKTSQLELTNSELQKFAFVASHDLQEPLRKILTFISLMERDPEAVSENGKYYFGKIVNGATRMQTLIDDILRFSSISNSRGGYEQVDLNVVLRQVLQDLEPAIRESNAEIHTFPLPVIEGVPTQLGQLLQNLLRNAIKFARPGVAPRIYVEGRTLSRAQLPANVLANMPSLPAGLGQNRWAELRIRDHGIGFEQVYADKIFEIFQRLHSNKTYQGTGIGLAIVRKIVEFHRGFIYAVGWPDEGAEFVILLPVSQEGDL